jgi:hypothetical protein
VQNVRVLNGLLWILNGLLGVGILGFSYRYLIAQDPNYLGEMRWDEGPVQAPPPPVRVPEGPLKSLHNPIEKGSPEGPVGGAPSFRATLKGTIASERDPKRSVAFLKSQARNSELVAYMDEEIGENGKPSDEFRGWKLQEVGKDYAVFSNGAQKQILTLDLSAPPSPGAAPGAALGGGVGPRSSQSYSSAQFKSRLLASSDSRHVWGIDPDEIEWAIQNQESLMDQAFQVSPAGGGGVKIDNIMAGTIGAARGLMPGDIVRDVNGQPLNTIADMRNLLNNPSMRQQTGMRLTIERAGRPVVIEYKPLPGK